MFFFKDRKNASFDFRNQKKKKSLQFEGEIKNFNQKRIFFYPSFKMHTPWMRCYSRIFKFDLIYSSLLFEQNAHSLYLRYDASRMLFCYAREKKRTFLFEMKFVLLRKKTCLILQLNKIYDFNT